MNRLLLLLLCAALAGGCHLSGQPARGFSEFFEQGSKRAYAAGVLRAQSGEWQLEGALAGRTASDPKHGSQSLRLQPGGTAAMRFDLDGDFPAVQLSAAAYAGDRAGRWELSYSSDGGAHWTRAGDAQETAAGTLRAAVVPVQLHGRYRFRIRNAGPGRLNIDDFRIVDATGTAAAPGPAETESPATTAAGRDDNLALGNPSDARTDADNYLLRKPQYALSYNDARGIPNWVSWHLSAAWKGDAPRCNCFSSDATLPAAFPRVTTSQYSGSGFDRGHLCPSDDRDGNAEDNAATFLMTNMAPQAPALNRHVWESLESYCRRLVSEGKELYLIAGSYGSGGSAGATTVTTIAGGRIAVPAHFWKIAVVLPEGGNDLARIDRHTRVIAVDMPNQESINGHAWTEYRTSVAAIEQATGYRFFGSLPAPVRQALRTAVDTD